MLVFVNSYWEGQTDDFESQGPVTDRLDYLAIGKNGCHQVHVEWAFIKQKKSQLSKDFRFAPETVDIKLRTLRPK